MVEGAVVGSRHRRQTRTDVDKRGETMLMAGTWVRRQGRQRRWQGRQRPRQLQEVVGRFRFLFGPEGEPVCLLCKYLERKLGDRQNNKRGGWRGKGGGRLFVKRVNTDKC
jgi:hypothetical protein